MMSDSRKRLSGSEYRKRARERQKNEREVLNKTPKLQHSFSESIGAQITANLNMGRTTSISNSTGSQTSPEMPLKNVDNPQRCSVSTSKNPMPQTHWISSCSRSKGAAQLNSKESCNDLPSPPSQLPVSGASVENCPTSLENTIPELVPIINRKVSDDPAEWIINDSTRDILLQRGIDQNIPSDFSQTKREYADRARYLSHTVFTRTLPNGETQSRPWLVFSKSKSALFCASCKLFGKISILTEGYSDWKNIYQRLKEHENSFEHKSATAELLDRSNTKGRVDKALIISAERAIEYWRNGLKRVVAVIKSLSIRGLPFRGSNEKFHCNHNGNYLMSLELIAEFDPFLAEHIRLYSNKGSGSTSYLSSTICEEFIHLMAEQVRNKILMEVKAAKYFSISVDSTPDISHVDQLTFIIRYVDREGFAIERFLTFIPNAGHKAKELASCVLSTLEKHNIDIQNCRGQSYDNASNMSGTYAGLQALVKEVSPLADYVPCTAHSLNLVGKCSAECCPEAVHFFSVLQQLYNFFTASTHRWAILLSHIKSDSSVVKNLSQTRWSARRDACRSLSQSRNEILCALQEMAEDQREKPVTRSEALGLFNSLNCLENCILALLWNDVLNRFHSVSSALQSTNINLTMVVELYESLTQYINNMRTMFDSYEKMAVDTCGIELYRHDISRRHRYRAQFEEEREKENSLNGKENFRIKVFCVIIDRLRIELEKRAGAYVTLNKKFGFITKLLTMKPEAIEESAQNLQSYYPDDLEDTLDVEFRHLAAHLSSLGIDSYTIFYLSTMLIEKNLLIVYPNIHIALRIFLCIAATNCSGERSFSALRRVKTYLRSTVGQERLNALSLLTREAELTSRIDYDCIIDDFARNKVRRVRM